ncbi:MAG: RNA methyltransferase [Clostridia bacterium]|nr:RNA methyltransferase [Clostridia bacterium]
MEVITSTQNRFVKEARSLAQRKFRVSTGLSLVEGIILLRDMPKLGFPEYVFSTADRLSEACEIFSERGVPIYQVTDSVIESLADTATPYGIAAVCKMPRTELTMPVGNALLLDGVSDPGNMGTILRTAAACDFCDVYLLDTVDVYSPKVIRATLGALFKVRVHEVNEAQALEIVHNTNSAALDMGGSNILHTQVATPVLFVAGNEAHGVRQRIMDEVKEVYSLPMKNQIESLNVAVATAVAMYQTI